VKQLKRMAGWFEAEYEKLILRMRVSKVIHADETGWRIDGENAWTWVFTQPLLTLFVIDRSRGGAVVKDVLGQAFTGTLVSDFYGAYDQLDCPKQKCLTHLLREIKEEGEKDEVFAGDAWVMKLRKWCKDAIAQKKKWKQPSDPKYERGASRLEDRLDELIRIEPGHVEAKRLSKRLKKHRPNLTRFLWDEALERSAAAAAAPRRPRPGASSAASWPRRNRTERTCFSKRRSCWSTTGPQRCGKQLPFLERSNIGARRDTVRA
jgi:hypothetical protein